MKSWRNKYPVKAAYAALRDNSKRRGIEFSITLQQFIRFCVKTQLLTNRGTKAESYSIDRKDETKGYSYDNIQMLTISENSKKEIKRRYVYIDGEGQMPSGLKIMNFAPPQFTTR